MGKQAEIQLNTKRRQSILFQLITFSNFIEAVVPATKTNTIQARLDQMKQMYSVFNEIQTKLEILAENSEEELAERAQFENQYFDMISEAQTILDTRNSYSAVQGNSLVSAASAISPQQAFNLPKINLPTFSGNYNEFLHFFELYNSLIHSNNGLSKIQKFYYLSTSLTGEAANVIESLEVCEKNYDTAYSLFKQRYENKKVIIQNHMKALFDLKQVNKECHLELRQFLDTFLKHFRALKSAGQPVEYWDTPLIYLISSKLDYSSKKEWEIFSNKIDNTTIANFSKFLQDRCQILEAISSHSSFSKQTTYSQYQKPQNKVNFQLKHSKLQTVNHLATASNQFSCSFCKGTHNIYNCEKFIALEPPQRLEEARRLRLCINCLRLGHFGHECKSMYNCKTCRSRHNSLLHIFHKNQDQSNVALATQNLEASDIDEEPITQIQEQMVGHCSSNQNLVLLSTANILVYNSNQQPIKCRALLDSGSMSNFITRDLANKLNLKQQNVNVPILGISGANTNIRSKVVSKVKSLNGNFNNNFSFLIIDRLTQNLPQITFNADSLKIPDNLQLADPYFYKSQPIDMLLGAEIFSKIMTHGNLTLGKNQPNLQNTELGWILSGPLSIPLAHISNCYLATDKTIQDQLESFWKIEEPCVETKAFSNEENECEDHFSKTHILDNNRFIVRLPTKDNLHDLGESYSTALRRYHFLEKKLSRNSSMHRDYHAFMQEYISLNHMTEISNAKLINENHSKLKYYIPQQIVIKESSQTTKCRVVFDASCPTSTSLSLNDVLKVGPTIQDDLSDIVIRSRIHDIVILGDITKMYRQVYVHQLDKDLQRILYRESISESIKHFRLNTVTYGTGPASFLSIRSLIQLANNNITEFPIESNIIIRDFYVDNLMTGAKNIEDAKRIITNLINILSQGSFELRQWMSNSEEVLEFLRLSNNSNIEHYILSDTKQGNLLGLTWNPHLDIFIYQFTGTIDQSVITKRTILSTIAKIFDPLGLLAPIIIVAKLILQSLWKLDIGWDDSIPIELADKFKSYISSLENINSIKIPRQLSLKNSISYSILGFCDSSSVAYGACLYLKSINCYSEVQTMLICAKSRVAPLKIVTIPRLELCAAVLLTRLLKKTVAALSVSINIRQIVAHSDSTIVLSWIRLEPCKLKTFVANRVSEIQSYSNVEWRHIRSENNPADCLSRGISAEELTNHPLWWYGPSFPLVSESDFVLEADQLPDVKSEQTALPLIIQNRCNIFDRFSNLNTLIKVTAYCCRFIHNCQPREKFSGPLSLNEFNAAKLKLIFMCQQETFPDEFKKLQAGRNVSNHSKLSDLNPFLDKDRIIRVGGRLQKADIDYKQKHQIVLPSKHPFTVLLIRNTHLKNLHAGTQLLMSTIRQEYWPLNCRQTIRSVLRNCITCFRMKPITLDQQMGQLPDARVTQGRVFSKIGLDFAGPYDLKDGKLRSRTFVKAYVCLFICLATKAVHIELVGDLSSDSFLNALKRFISRRGICEYIMSDNATNFIGAENKLKDLMSNADIVNYTQSNNICWKFIPARSPHFGGLWESNIKCMKFHLKRVLLGNKLTYEEMYTILTQVEAMLNSRPLVPLTNDANDIESLTPGHFLIGCPLNALPEHSVLSIPMNRLDRFQQLQHHVQYLWSRWSQDYLNTLQQRTKWKWAKENKELKGALVLLKEDNIPPLQWILARVVDTHPGPDGLVRTVSVKTRLHITRRSITKICLLPTNE